MKTKMVMMTIPRSTQDFKRSKSNRPIVTNYTNWPVCRQHVACTCQRQVLAGMPCMHIMVAAQALNKKMPLSLSHKRFWISVAAMDPSIPQLSRVHPPQERGLDAEETLVADDYNGRDFDLQDESIEQSLHILLNQFQQSTETSRWELVWELASNQLLRAFIHTWMGTSQSTSMISRDTIVASWHANHEVSAQTKPSNTTASHSSSRRWWRWWPIRRLWWA